jgi:DNA-binding MarR family transcriptional regulator
MSESQLVLDAIRRIVRALRNFSKSTEKDIGLSTAQIYVLQKLKESNRPLTVNELAEATLTHQSSVSVVVSKLVHRKLIDRAADKQDSRSVRLSITGEGKYLLGKSPTSIQERLTKALAKMTAKERKGLVEGLQALILNAGMQDEEAPMLLEDEK